MYLPWNSGSFTSSSARLGMSEAQAFDNAFDLVEVAERGGLDAVWLAELHFSPNARCWPHPCCSRAPSARAPATSRSARPSRSCRCAIRCSSPRRPPPSTTSAAGA